MLEDFLKANKVIGLRDFIANETALKLYYDMTDNAVFLSSLVTETQGDPDATEDTHTGQVLDERRVSETAFNNSFTPLAEEIIKGITAAVCEVLGVEPDRFEPWQCTRYFTGGKFEYHSDCGNWASNERLYTVMLTLRAADVGGATHFPRLHITAESKGAQLLIWRNLNEDYICDGMAEHAGLPVGAEGHEDEKMILVTWVRRFKYEN